MELPLWQDTGCFKMGKAGFMIGAIIGLIAVFAMKGQLIGFFTVDPKPIVYIGAALIGGFIGMMFGK